MFRIIRRGLNYIFCSYYSYSFLARAIFITIALAIPMFLSIFGELFLCIAGTLIVVIVVTLKDGYRHKYIKRDRYINYKFYAILLLSFLWILGWSWQGPEVGLITNLMLMLIDFFI